MSLPKEPAVSFAFSNGSAPERQRGDSRPVGGEFFCQARTVFICQRRQRRRYRSLREIVKIGVTARQESRFGENIFVEAAGEQD